MVINGIKQASPQIIDDTAFTPFNHVYRKSDLNRCEIPPVPGLKRTMVCFLPLEQQFVHPADSFQRYQDHDLDWTLEIGLEGGTGSVTVWDWDGSSLMIPYSSGGKKRGFRDYNRLFQEMVEI